MKKKIYLKMALEITLLVMIGTNIYHMRRYWCLTLADSTISLSQDV